jgi:uncharacterized Zn finger protein
VVQVQARVQGSRPEPCEVAIRVTPLCEAAWKRVAAGAAEQVL